MFQSYCFQIPSTTQILKSNGKKNANGFERTRVVDTAVTVVSAVSVASAVSAASVASAVSAVSAARCSF